MQTSIARLPKVKAITGLSRSEIYRREAEGRFPQRVVLGPRCVGWLENEVYDYISQHAAKRLKAA